MVNELVYDKTVVEQKVNAYRERLTSFYPNKDHLWMAYLAAFPVSVNMNLMYQLWANFNLLKDKEGHVYRIHVLCVSDCILSQLFTLAGPDLYEMDSNIRACLLEELEKKFGNNLLKELASFLYKYAIYHKAENNWKNFNEAQEWAAILAVDPGKAAENILGSLKGHIDDGNTFQSIGIANLVAMFAKDNRDFASLVKDSLEPANNESAEEAVKPPVTPSTGRKQKNIVISGGGNSKNKISVPLPVGISRQFSPIYKNALSTQSETIDKKKESGKPVTYGLFVAYNDYPAAKNQQVLSIGDANLLKDFLIKNGFTVPANVITLFDRDATKHSIMRNLQALLSKAAKEDTVLFYFGGAGSYSNNEPGLLCYDAFFDQQQTGRGIITATEFRRTIESFSRKDPSIVSIIDADDVCSRRWLDPGNAKHFALLNSRPNDYFLYDDGSFTQALINRLARSSTTNYKDLFKYLWTGFASEPPLFVINHESWNKYFLSDTTQPVVRSIQLLLNELGYRVTVDGLDGPQTVRVYLQFNEKYNLQDSSMYQTYNLERAILLQQKDKIKVGCLFNQDSDSYFYVQKIREALLRRRADVTMRSLPELIPSLKTGVNSSSEPLFSDLKMFIREADLLFVGLTAQLVDNTEAILDLRVVIDIAAAMDKQVIFIIEKECDWKKPPFNAHTVLPLNFKPVETAEGLDYLLDNGELDVVLDGYEKFLKPLPQSQEKSIEEKIADAAITGELDLSKTELAELPGSIRSMVKLRVLDISDNKLMVLPGWMVELSNLEVLKINGNKMIRTLPHGIDKLKSLRTLNAENTLLYDLPEDFDQLGNLRELYISNTRIAVIDPNWLSSLRLDVIRLDKDVINIPPFLDDNFQKLQNYYFFSLQSRSKFFLSVIEIHSENALPHYNRAPAELKDNVGYVFFDKVEQLHNVFRIICQNRGMEHTIVYLCDEKNILVPEFGENDILQQRIYNYFKALHTPINLIFNNPLIGRPALADLTVPGLLNFAAVRNDRVIRGKSFSDLFFEKLYQKNTGNRLKAFVCSTVTDLVIERKQVRDFLRKALFDVIDMEEYPGEGINIIERLSNDVKSADIFVLLIGEKYGPIAPLEAKDQKSFIEYEFDIAMQNKKPIFTFIKTNPRREEQLNTFIARLSRDYVTTPFSLPSDLIVQLARSVSSFQRDRPGRSSSLVDILTEILGSSTTENGDTGYDLLANFPVMRDFTLYEDASISLKADKKNTPVLPLFCIDIYKNKVAWLRNNGDLAVFSTDGKILERRKLKEAASFNHNRCIGLNLRINTAYIQMDEEVLLAYNMETFKDETISLGFAAKKLVTNSRSEVAVLGDGPALLNVNGSPIAMRDHLITPSAHVQVIREGLFSVIASARYFAVYKEGKKISQVAAFRKSISAICFGSWETIFVAGIDEENIIIKCYDKEKTQLLYSIPTQVTVVNDMSCSEHGDIAFATDEGGYILDYEGRHQLVSKQENMLRIAFAENGDKIVIANSDEVYLYQRDTILLWTFNTSTLAIEPASRISTKRTSSSEKKPPPKRKK
jgi:hypothetical protein